MNNNTEKYFEIKKAISLLKKNSAKFASTNNKNIKKSIKRNRLYTK